MKKIKFFDVVDFNSDTKRFQVLKDGFDYVITSPLLNHGTTFTPKAASELIFAKVIELEPDIAAGKDKTMAIEFSKLALLQILMQDDCEGIRFVECKGIKPDGSIDKDDESLVAIGIDSKGVPLGADHFRQGSVNMDSKPIPLTKEKGNKIKASTIRGAIIPDEPFKIVNFETNFLKSLI
jgi:hypothetical protein